VDKWDKAPLLGVRNVRVTDTMISGDVMSYSGETVYTPFIDIEGTFFCGCIGNISHNVVCSHITALLYRVPTVTLLKFLLKLGGVEK
jgi:hypothetical protein